MEIFKLAIKIKKREIAFEVIVKVNVNISNGLIGVFLNLINHSSVNWAQF